MTPTLDVLVATVNQSDTSLTKRMNLRSSAIIVNQADRFTWDVISEQTAEIHFITVPGRGVGRNRNLSLMLSDADICLFADDDVTYVDNYEEVVQRAFVDNPGAGAIIFNVSPINTRRPHTPIRRRHRIRMHNGLRYATYQIAVRREVILSHNVFFSLLFGGGAKYSAGEDSLFIADCLRRGIRIVAVPESLGQVDMSSSSWFTGFNDKYLFDKGVFLAALSRSGAHLLAVRFVFRHRSLFNERYSRLRMFRIMREGIRHYCEET